MPRVSKPPATRLQVAQVRIIGGVWRSRRLSFYALDNLRPTPDRVRETVFNWLQPVIAGMRCLDLFAGTGVLGLEALSRGATHCTLIEKDAQTVRALRDNITRLGALGATELLQMNGLDYLQQSRPQDSGVPPYDLVFLDPPFQSVLLVPAMELLETHGWIKPGGLIYIETPKSGSALTLPSMWQLRHSKNAGQVGYNLAKRG